MTSNGTVIASIGANKVQDVGGNENSASTSTDNSVYYNGFCTAPTIVASGQPNNQNINYGLNASFSVSATGTGELTYRWEEFTTIWSPILDGGIYSGATTETLTLTKPPVTWSGRKYRVVVSGECNPITVSDAAMLTVSKAVLTVTADNQTKVYGAANPELTFQYSGWVNGTETIDIAPTASTTVDSSTEVDTYDDAITLAGGNDNNYTFNLVPAAFTVTKAVLTVTAVAGNITYGDAAPSVTVQYAGFVGSDDATDLDNTSFDLGTDYTQYDAVGTYNTTIGIGTADDNNYNFNPLTPSTFEVGKLDLAVTAVAGNITYGDAAPSVTVQYAGFVGSDDATDLDNTSFDLGTDYTQYDAVGTYNTTIGIGTADDNNYNFNPLTPSTFEVAQKNLTITAKDQVKFCGQTITFTGNEFTQVGLINGDMITSATLTSAGSASSANGDDLPYQITIEDALGSGLNNYNISYVPGSLTVNPVSFIISDAQTPRPVNQSFTIKVVVKDLSETVSGVNVKLFIGGIERNEVPVETNGTYTFTLPAMPADLYEVYATAGGSCSESESVFLPIFDPNGGFVTGGGWIISPAGAMKGDYVDATGKANFGFNAKYKNGKNTMNEVDGNTNFQFKAGDFHFKSFEHDNESLILVSGGFKATYTGSGTVDGRSGTFKFRVTVIDAEESNLYQIDLFRIRIWNDAGVVYDNNISNSENADPATEISGGSIVIHKPKGGGKTAETTQTITLEKGTVELTQETAKLDILGNLAVAPNPVRTDAKVRFSLIEDAGVTVRLFDFNGREIYNLYSGNAKANEVYEVGFQRNNMMSGIYIVRLTTDRGQSYTKQVIVE